MYLSQQFLKEFHKRSWLTLKGLALGVALVATVHQASAQEAEGTTNCVSLSAVDRTEVLDDSTIMFYMNNGRMYMNELPHRCPGLREDGTFMYRVSTTQLCNIDVITVLERFGAGFMQGASCGLGKFQPVSEAPEG